MPVKTIYIVRHGFRGNWITHPHTGATSALVPSPTGIDSDPALSSYGVGQAEELVAALRAIEPPIDRIYSSPFYRCIQTLAPFLRALGREGAEAGAILDPGLGEWYGTARFDHPSPASPALLQSLFQDLSLRFTPSILPSPRGETIPELHDRVAYTMKCILADCARNNVETILICTHAATIIALARVLTGKVPVDNEEEDFHTYTCGISTFISKEEMAKRQDSAVVISADVEETSVPQTSVKEVVPATREDGLPPGKEPVPEAWSVPPTPYPEIQAWTPNQPIPYTNWRGTGLNGGFVCTVDSDCDHLTHGAERHWHFSGDEAFLDPDSDPDLDPHSGHEAATEGSGIRSGYGTAVHDQADGVADSDVGEGGKDNASASVKDDSNAVDRAKPKL
ncbi:MAG: hypothetical protein Q9187_001811 [Circinaria calcarea]